MAYFRVHHITILLVALLGRLNKYLQNFKCTFSMSLYGYGAYISLPYNNIGVTNESNSSDIRSTGILRFLAFLYTLKRALLPISFI